MEIPIYKSSSITSFAKKEGCPLLRTAVFGAILAAGSASWFLWLHNQKKNEPKRDTVQEIIERRQRSNEMFDLWVKERGDKTPTLPNSSIKTGYNK